MTHLKAHHLCSPCAHFSHLDLTTILFFQRFSNMYEMWFVVQALVVFYEECRKGQIFLCSELKHKESLLAVS